MNTPTTCGRARPCPPGTAGRPARRTALRTLRLRGDRTPRHSASGHRGGGDALRRALSRCAAAGSLAGTCAAWWDEQGRALPRQLIHGDYGLGNVPFRGGELAAVLDLDFLAERERVYDLAYSLYWRLLGDGSDPAAEDEVRSRWDLLAGLLDAYDARSARPLSAAERRALPMVMARVPLYFAATAGRTTRGDGPVAEVLRAAPGLALARWLVQQADDLDQQLAAAVRDAQADGR